MKRAKFKENEWGVFFIRRVVPGTHSQGVVLEADRMVTFKILIDCTEWRGMDYVQEDEI